MRLEIPDWWLVATLVVYSMAIVAVVAMIVAAFQLLRLIVSIGSKVGSLALKVQGLSEKVSALSTEVKSVGKNLSLKSRPIAAAATDMAETTATNIARYAPLIALTSTGLKLLETFQATRARD